MHETAILLHKSNRGKKGTREGKKGAREGKKGAREGKKGAAPFYFGLAGTLSMAWEPDRRSNFFSPPAHLCVVTGITEISLIMMLSNQHTNTYTIYRWL